MSAPDFHDGKRYGVTRYYDAQGAYFAVIDRQYAGPGVNIVYTTIYRDAAHTHADRRNRDALARSVAK